jgi:hypothetical protein
MLPIVNRRITRITGASRQGRRLGLVLALAAATAGCGTMSDAELHSLLGTLSSVATAAVEARGQYKAAKTGTQPAANQGQGGGYSSLGCVQPVQRAGGVCAQNSCGQPVVYHVRFANGATNALAVNAGACIPVPPGVQVFACRGSDRVDWGRSACGG